MIVAFKHVDMSERHLGEFYDSMQGFATSKFNIEVSDEGYILINGDRNFISYKLGDGTGGTYTKEEALKDYCRSRQFKEYAKSRFYTVYSIKDKLI